MSGSINELCAWAAGLTPDRVPAGVLRVARLQHLSLAGAAARLAPLAARGSCGTGMSGELAAFLLYHFDDHLLGGRVGAASAPLSWASARGSLDELLVATVAANEVAARVGLAGGLGRGPGEIDLRSLRVGAAVMKARLEKAGEQVLTRAVEAAISGGRTVQLAAVSDAAGAARVAGEVYGSGGGKAASSTELDAWGGAGTVWFTSSLVVPKYPGSPGANVALDALDVILGRHLKAGEKRLRADQVERIDVRVAFAAVASPAMAEGLAPPALGAWSLPEALSLLCVHHELGPEWLDLGASGSKTEDVHGLSSRVTVTHDWRLTLRRARMLGEALGPLLGPAGVGTLLGAARPHLTGLPELDQLVATLRERPWELAMSLRKRGGLEACDLVAARAFPTELKLYTTRGGWWPERRCAPTGTGEGLEVAARARFANDKRADSLLDAPGSRAAAEWVAELRG